MRGGTPAAWLETAGTVLFAPRRFYDGLQLRSPGSTERGFAGWTYVLIGLGAFSWAAVMFLAMGLIGRGPTYFYVELLFVFAVYAMTAAIGCWLGHRVIAAVVVSWWLARGMLPDGRWAAKVIAYESTFLWVFCAYWGVLGSSFMLLEDWMTQTFGRGPGWLPLGMPVEVAVVLLGTLALGIVWLWRYRVARRAIQWNNF